MELSVKSIENKEVGKTTLSEDVFGVEVRADLLHRMVNYQLAKRRAGTHKTKGISEISGTGKKPFAQKGTGRARKGSLRSAEARGGATIFGPVVRDHSHKLPKKVRRLAMKTALSAKAKDGKLIILDQAKLDAPKTKGLVNALKDLGIDSALFVDAQVDGNFAKAVNNIPRVDVLPQIGANVYDILRRDFLVLTTDAVEALEARLK